MTGQELTQQQRKVLDFLTGFIAQRGFAPSLREIGRAVGLPNVNAVRGHVAALERKAYIIRDHDKARSIRLADGPSRLSRLKRKMHKVMGTDEGVLHQIVYGLVWATWGRQEILRGERADLLAAALQREAVEHGWTIEQDRIEPDHVVVVVRSWPNHSAERTVRRFQTAGRALLRRHPERFPVKRLWADGYAATTDVEALDEMVATFLNDRGPSPP